jgi:hypothetical protein
METVSEEAIRLVLGVARLGELDLAGWWSTHGLDRTGSYILARAFKRTWRPAALELDLVSAQRRHDDALAGRRTALHLFSDELPFRRWASSWLAEQKTAAEPSRLFDDLSRWDLQDARAVIGEWAGDAPGAEVVGDGLRLGQLSSVEITDPDTLASVARQLVAAYLAIGRPFRAPYFDG